MNRVITLANNAPVCRDIQVVPVFVLNKHDIVFGKNIYRCAASIGYSHKRNEAFRTFINLHKWQFCISKSGRKKEIAMSILNHCHQNVQCRFILQHSEDRFEIISDRKVQLQKILNELTKASEGLRIQLHAKLAAATSATQNIAIPSTLVAELLDAKFILEPKKKFDIQTKNNENVKHYGRLTFPCKTSDIAELVVESIIQHDTVDETSVSPFTISGMLSMSPSAQSRLLAYDASDTSWAMQNDEAAYITSINSAKSSATPMQIDNLSLELSFSCTISQNMAASSLKSTTLQNKTQVPALDTIEIESRITGTVASVPMEIDEEMDASLGEDALVKTNPVKKAIINNQSASSVLEMIQLHKDAVEEIDDLGMYPLHYAINTNQSKAVVLKLLEVFPKATEYKYKNNDEYPLHRAFALNQSEEVVLKLIQLYEPAVSHLDGNGSMYPLHYACLYPISERVVLKLLEVFPMAAHHKDKQNNVYPLYYVCSHNEWETALLELIEVYPTAVQHIDTRHDFYPLHRSCVRNHSKKVVLELIRKFPYAVTHKDKVNDLYPLHYACTFNQSETVVLKLIKKFEGAVRHKDNLNDWFPLHRACDNNQSKRVVMKLIKLYPAAVKLKDKFNAYPLHYACAKNQSKDVIMKLIKECPDAVRCKDINSMYPYQYASMNNQCEKVL